MKKIKIVSIVGPTAVGKTALAVELSKKFDIEIVSADSMQIYKEFNILSAKPTSKDLKTVPHHLINTHSVSESYSVAQFVDEAKTCIKETVSKNKIPCLVGGTGLYIDSLVKNVDFINSSQKHISLSENLSNDQIMEALMKVDPESASKIHINNTKRLKRALEFFNIYGYPISKQVENSKKIESPFIPCIIGLSFLDRDTLYSKINSRVDKMFEDGILEEVKNIHSTMNVSKTAFSAIGYKEIVEYLNNEKTIQEVRETIKQATRRYAKRQLTWFRRNSSVNWIYLDQFADFSKVVERSQEIIESFLYNE